MIRPISYLALICMTVMLFVTIGGLPVLYDPNSPASTHVSDYYIENSYKDTSAPNYVTAVLADYRGFDTLGETTVIFTAGVTTILLLRANAQRQDKAKRGDGE